MENPKTLDVLKKNPLRSGGGGADLAALNLITVSQHTGTLAHQAAILGIANTA